MPLPPRLILASASPRRQSLLREAGYEFEVVPANVDEEQYPAGLLPAEIARYLAGAKADAIAAEHPNAVVLAADTVVALGDQPLGKPTDAQAARKMLELLAGTTHVVITGVAVVHKAAGFVRSGRIMSAVHMREVAQHEIDEYVSSGEWQGKAGGYGIQDKDPFVMRTAGSHTNIVGLPMRLTKYLLSEAGILPAKPHPPRHTNSSASDSIVG